MAVEAVAAVLLSLLHILAAAGPVMCKSVSTALAVSVTVVAAVAAVAVGVMVVSWSWSGRHFRCWR